jgi:hypothetical protein
MKTKKQRIPGICFAYRCTNKTATPGTTFCSTCRNRMADKRMPEKRCFRDLKASAKKRGIPFDLTFSEFLRFCKRCEFIAGKNRERKHTSSVDRINDDPAKGYHGYRKDNIQPLPVGYNSRKYQLQKKLDFDYRYPDKTKVISLGPKMRPAADDPF